MQLLKWFSLLKEVVMCNENLRQQTVIGSGAICLVGGSSVETKIAEGIRDAKNQRFVL